jgi:hypothetical protein
MLLGAFGPGYFIYGKKQKMIMALLCGMALMVYPYFVSNEIALVCIGIVLLAVSWFIRY